MTSQEYLQQDSFQPDCSRYLDPLLALRLSPVARIELEHCMTHLSIINIRGKGNWVGQGNSYHGVLHNTQGLMSIELPQFTTDVSNQMHRIHK